MTQCYGAAQIYDRGLSQAVDGRLMAALQALHGGAEDAEAYAKAAVGTRCREVHTTLLSVVVG